MESKTWKHGIPDVSRKGYDVRFIKEERIHMLAPKGWKVAKQKNYGFGESDAPVYHGGLVLVEKAMPK